MCKINIKQMVYFSTFLSLLVLSPFCYAESFGQIATEMLEPVLAISELVKIICLVTGIAMCVMGIIRYKERRQGEDVTLGSVFFYILVGLALIALSLLMLPGQLRGV